MGRENNKGLDVKLTNQSFAEAGGSKEFPNLEIGGIVLVTTYNQSKNEEYLLEEAHKSLIEKAGKLGYTHVFGIKNERHIVGDKHESYGHDYKVIGTGYKPKH